MKKNIILSVYVVVLGIFLSGVTSAGELKIGYVKSARLLTEAPQVRSAENRLEEEFSPRKNELMAMQQDMRDLEEKLARDAAVMKAEEKRSVEKDILSRRREMKRLDDEFREDFSIRRNELLSSLQVQMNNIVTEFAKNNGYDLVLADGAVYVSESIDVTDSVLQKMRNEFGGEKKTSAKKTLK